MIHGEAKKIQEIKIRKKIRKKKKDEALSVDGDGVHLVLVGVGLVSGARCSASNVVGNRSTYGIKVLFALILL